MAPILHQFYSFIFEPKLQCVTIIQNHSQKSSHWNWCFVWHVWKGTKTRQFHMMNGTSCWRCIHQPGESLSWAAVNLRTLKGSDLRTGCLSTLNLKKKTNCTVWIHLSYFSKVHWRAKTRGDIRSIQVLFKGSRLQSVLVCGWKSVYNFLALVQGQQPKMLIISSETTVTTNSNISGSVWSSFSLFFSCSWPWARWWIRAQCWLLLSRLSWSWSSETPKERWWRETL